MTLARLAAATATTLVAIAAAETPDVDAAALTPRAIICHVFGPRHCRDALRVARCESRFDLWARNGQYLGLFQMGSAERRRFGFGWNAWTQARAARAYFRVAGWHPWTCQP